jgi:hypothetical protein
MTDDIVELVRARAANPRTIHDMAQGLSPAPKIYPPATAEDIEKAEASLGFELPALLKRIYTEIGNGGFGPGYGLVGTAGGYDGCIGGDVLSLYGGYRENPPGGMPEWPEKVLPICTWGCDIYSCLDCSKLEAPVLVYGGGGEHALGYEGLEITMEAADGRVIEIDGPEDLGLEPDPDAPAPPPAQLVPNKPTLEAWLADWARGVDLWGEMEGLR